MNRRKFLAGGAALAASVAAVSCARMEQRSPQYNPKECPFCSQKPGICSYCAGSGKCSFCGGKGKRTTVVPSIETDNGMLKKSSYEESCPFCKGSGACRYCDGKGKCLACRGTGAIEDWNFYQRSKKES